MTRDRIDRFEEAWTKAYPNLDPWPLKIFGRVTRLAGILEQQGRDLREAFGVHRGEIQVLAALRRTPPDYTASPKELAEHTLVTSAAVTSRLNSLEEKGLVTRRIDERSRRRILVTLTPEGVEVIEAYMKAFIANQSGSTSSLSVSEREEMEAALRRLLLLVGDSVNESEASPNYPGLDLV